MIPPLQGVGAAYDASAAAWVAGPEPAYDAMAVAVIAASPVPVRGARVLDIGAGAGAASRAARAGGAASVVGLDVAAAMLQVGSGWTAALVGDAAHLPFSAGTFDLVVAACCLGHLPDADAGLLEARRVAPSLVASAFLAGWTHPAKALVDGVAAAFGFTVPPWYARLKAEVEARIDDPEQLAELARAAGYRQVVVTVAEVDLGLPTPAAMVGWRLGMAHLAPFVGSLSPGRRDQLYRACVRAVDGCPPPVVPLVLLAAC